MNIKVRYILETDRRSVSKETIWDGIFAPEEILKDETIDSCKAWFKLPIQENEFVFLNGFQSWTFSPEMQKTDSQRGLNGLPEFLVKKYHFDRYGDYYFEEYPNTSGIFHGYSYGYLRNGNHYRLFASLSEENGYTIFRYDANKQVLEIERDCKGLKVNGNFRLFDLFYEEGEENRVFDDWFEAMSCKPRTTEGLYGYSSWYNRYQNISHETIRQDLEGCKSLLKPGDLFQIDDGWEPFVGDWMYSDDKKFPEGMKKECDAIHEAGFKAGLWLAPFVAETKSTLYRIHPDWFLKDKDTAWACGSNWSGFYALDIDHPQVQEYLRAVFHRILDEWGFDLVKLDFLYGAAPLNSENETRAGRMIRALKFLRDLCGEKLILGCGVPLMPAFGLVDYCRIGCDVSLDWDDKVYMHIMHRERNSTCSSMQDTIYRRQLNDRAWLNDPDVYFLRKNNCRLNEVQKENLIALDAVAGGVFLTSDDPSSYTETMREEYNRYRRVSEEGKNKTITAEREAVVICYTLDDMEIRRTIDLSRKPKRF